MKGEPAFLASEMKPKIFITQPVAQNTIDRLRRIAEVSLNPDRI